MVAIDWSWVTIWAVVGCVCFFIPFDIPRVKGALGMFSAITFVSLALKTNMFQIFGTIANDLATSTASSAAYLFTANISRVVVMRVPPSKNMIIYAVILILSFAISD